MKLSLLVLTFLMSLNSLADGFGVIPSLNEAPIFWGMLNSDPRYKDAALKAQEAFLIQSGVIANYNLITGYVKSEAAKALKGAENTAATVIDEHTPLSSKQVFFLAAIGYTAFVKKEVSQSFKNPIFRNVSHTITVGQKQQTLGINIPF